MKVLVCGSRSWHRDDLIHLHLVRLPRGAEVIHGGCRGADRMAGIIAARLGFPGTEFPAHWKGLGPRACPRRNLAMLDEGPDLVLAFQEDGSTGTQHTIDSARERGIPVEVVTP